MANADWQSFFEQNPPPNGLAKHEQSLKTFCAVNKDKTMVVVTSGMSNFVREIM